MIDFTVAVDKLAQFQTSDELADFLASEGIKGIRGSASRCPIAIWLSNQTEWFALAEQHYTMPFNGEARINTQAMEEFVHKFDTGWYSTLES